MLINLLINFCISLFLCSFILLFIDSRLRAQQKKNLFYQRQINELSEAISTLRVLIKTRGAATDALASKLQKVERVLLAIDVNKKVNTGAPPDSLKGTLKLKDKKGKTALVDAEFFLHSIKK